MRVYRSGRYIENSINEYVLHPEPCHERRNCPRGRERSCLDDVSYEEFHNHV
jgi:hypothetical protein